MHFQSALKSLEIVVEGGCPNGVPQLGMDESYKLNVTSSDAILKAVEVIISQHSFGKQEESAFFVSFSPSHAPDNGEEQNKHA